MLYRYICPICGFLFQGIKQFTHYRCPSCATVVQAIAYEEGKELAEVKMPETKEGVH